MVRSCRGRQRVGVLVDWGPDRILLIGRDGGWCGGAVAIRVTNTFARDGSPSGTAALSFPAFVAQVAGLAQILGVRGVAADVAGAAGTLGSPGAALAVRLEGEALIPAYGQGARVTVPAGAILVVLHCCPTNSIEKGLIPCPLVTMELPHKPLKTREEPSLGSPFYRPFPDSSIPAET